MKKKYLYLFIILCPTVSYAQSERDGRNFIQQRIIDTCRFSVIYKLERARDTVNKSYNIDNIILEVGKEYVKSHSLFAEVCDSIKYKSLIQKTRSDQGIDLYSWLKERERGFAEDYYFKYPNKNMLTVSTHIINTEYIYQEDIPIFNWNIDFNKTEDVLGYTCFYAQASFRGRIWHAWFTTEIPLNFGPWKFNGLPGVILKIMDSKELFRYNAIAISKSPRLIYIIDPSIKVLVCGLKVKQTNREAVLKLQDQYWKDPVGLGLQHGVKTAVMLDEVTLKFKYLQAGERRKPYIPPLELE